MGKTIEIEEEPNQGKNSICGDFDISEFNLRNILMFYSHSKRMLLNYERKANGLVIHQDLDDEERKIICNTVVEWAIDNNIMLQPDDFVLIAEEFKIIFAEEIISTYFIPSMSYHAINEQTNQEYTKQIQASGQLYSVWRYQLNKVRKKAKRAGDDVSIYYRNSKNPKKLDCKLVTNSEDMLEMKEWLFINFEPWEEIMSKWEITCQLRFDDIHVKKMDLLQLVKEWPRYLKKLGYQLVFIDFEFLYPGKDLLKRSFVKYREQIVNLALSRIKKNNKNVKEKLETFFKENIEDKESNIQSLICLHALFFLLPNKNTRTTQNLDIILTKAEPDKRIAHIVFEKSKEARSKNTFSPFIIYYENEKGFPDKIYVVLDDIYYQTENMITALDVLFKIFYVFHLQYPDECKSVLIFIQHFYYDILLVDDMRSKTTLNLIKALDSKKGKDLDERIRQQIFDVRY